ncbi:uncharacterized protein LY79DRAFT_286389 [Colletotrichum navitas]|uniref:ATPase AAA-type core domain-containing protein n=1 Tax=Colletotrichum navitas TaxID=681940 RepID=A0AAD8Q970_9PEZI|nr:uncharacterized protein LY79DRAFT_286389 [Colletotrichum navitas]KAK1598343.1 hypothetical protein LY79DRAFT_286389 [Colletotrichum navitas]
MAIKRGGSPEHRRTFNVPVAVGSNGFIRGCIEEIRRKVLVVSNAKIRCLRRTKSAIRNPCGGKPVSRNIKPLKADTTQSNPRYMVDMEMYNTLHSSDDEQEEAPTSTQTLAYEVMCRDEPPSGHFLLLLPPTILGFGMHDKKWRTLQVEHISAIEWNKNAFEQLVLDYTHKELIEAVVRGHVSSDASPDIVEGKGRGVLHSYGTVVLLDESDIFLEEREKMDLKRNALVSVFLRVLEYYEGILILTSNRVAHFDEAFKSRMQLTLHYPPIDLGGRKQIRDNFIDLLKQKEVLIEASHGSDRPEGEKVNIAMLKARRDALADAELNGRQIRNVVSTARQLARLRNKAMSFGHLQATIKTVNAFEKHVEQTHGHSAEEYARSIQSRLERQAAMNPAMKPSFRRSGAIATCSAFDWTTSLFLERETCA